MLLALHLRRPGSRRRVGVRWPESVPNRIDRRRQGLHRETCPIVNIFAARCRFRPWPFDLLMEVSKMRYMLMIYDEEKNFAKMSEAEMGKLMGEYKQFSQEVQQSGHFKAGGQLQPTATATS